MTRKWLSGTIRELFTSGSPVGPLCRRYLGSCFLILFAVMSIYACTTPPQKTEQGMTGGTTPAAPTATSATTAVPSPVYTPTISLAPAASPPPAAVPTETTAASPLFYTYKVLNTYPHDPQAFTQGLVWDGGVLYEGTGQRGFSTLRKVDLESGELLQIRDIPTPPAPEGYPAATPSPYFGEGITVYGDKIIQLTWRSQVGFVYDRESFELLDSFTYPTEGWGITHDGERLIVSDGTATLYFWDAQTLAEIGRVAVYDENGPVPLLNELEYIGEEVYANIWKTDRIARIAPQTGQVTGWIELSGLLSAEERSTGVDVLNGIAYDGENDRLFVTGKWWPKLFEIELVPLEARSPTSTPYP